MLVYLPKYLVMVLVDEAWGRYLGYEGRALVKEITVPIQEAPERSLTPSTKWGHKKSVEGGGEGIEGGKKKKNSLEKSPHSTMLASWSWASSLQNCKK